MKALAAELDSFLAGAAPADQELAVAVPVSLVARAATALSAHPAEETEYRTVARFKDGSDYEVESFGSSLSDAVAYARASNAVEPRPNIHGDDDIELTWVVEQNSRPTQQEWSAWSPVSEGSEQ